MRKLFLKFCFLILLFGCIACNPRITTYKQTLPTMPFLSNKGDLDINSGISTNHLETQVAYSPLKQVVITSDLFLSLANRADYKGFDFNPCANLGIGYYQSVGNDYKAELIAELGYGNIHYNYDKTKNYNGSNQVKWKNIYSAGSEYYTRSLIANFGKKIDKNFFLGIGVKFCSTHFLYNNYLHTFQDNSTSVFNANLGNTENTAYEMKDKTRQYFVPSLYMKVNFNGRILQHMALFFSLSEQLELDAPNEAMPYLYYTPFLLSSGFSYRFSSKK